MHPADIGKINWYRQLKHMTSDDLMLDQPVTCLLKVTLIIDNDGYMALEYNHIYAPV